MSVPAGMPKIAIGSISAASTQPILAVEPVVTRTNHGSATNVIAVPVSETSSAVMSPRSERFLSIVEIIKRPYGFVKCGRAEGRQAHLDARRAEILEGARRAFARHGYEGATVARLEEEIGLSRGAIFHYFDSKLDLFAALANSDNARYQALLADEGLDAVIRAIADADPEWLAVLIETEVKLLHDPEFQERIDATPEQRERLLDAFGRGRRTGSSAPTSRPRTRPLREDRDQRPRAPVAGGEPVDVEPCIDARERRAAPARLASPGENGSLRRRGPEPATRDRSACRSSAARRRGRPEPGRARASRSPTSARRSTSPTRRPSRRSAAGTRSTA